MNYYTDYYNIFLAMQKRHTITLVIIITLDSNGSDTGCLIAHTSCLILLTTNIIPHAVLPGSENPYLTLPTMLMFITVKPPSIPCL